MRLITLIISFFSVTQIIQGAETKFSSGQLGYNYKITPFFIKYCQKCHLGEKPKGNFGIDLKRLPNNFNDQETTAKWREIVNVLNSHEMPPEKSLQPTVEEVANVVDWITDQTVRSEIGKRGRSPVLRRLNREEYRNTIRDLLGINFDPEGFPQDAQAGGFDNNGNALTISPLQIELYLASAQKILDRAIVNGTKPNSVKWHFDPKPGPRDSTRVKLDDANKSAIVNGNKHKQEKQWLVMRDGEVDARNFNPPVPGNYLIRIHAAGRIPTKAQVIASADGFIKQQRDEYTANRPDAAKYWQDRYLGLLKHFQTDPIYDYGPPRAKIVVTLGPLPKTIAEFDVDASPEAPKTYEFMTWLSSETMEVVINYAYHFPSLLTNNWFCGNESFPRPELLIDWFEIEGPIYESWPPSSHTRLLNINSDPREELASAKEVIQRFLRLAYRRPVSPEEVHDKWASLYLPSRKANKSYFEAIKVPLIAILNSPNFLYLTEPHGDSKDGKPAALTDHEIASRLSYFLWSSMPDDHLFQLADSGHLKNPKVLQAQVDRMLVNEKTQAFVKNFAGQWLGLREVGANPPVPSLFPRYDRHLELSMIRESEAFFEEFLKSDLDIRQMIKSDFVVINECLARFYGIPNVRGDEFRKVKVNESANRGGIVTQASILTITSNGTRTSPVKRGNWILKTLLGIDPGLPVSNVGEIAPKVPGIDKATVRQRLEIHRSSPQCARCHNKIDPLGFALENYNAAGEFREQEGFGFNGTIQATDPKINSSAAMPDGIKIDGVVGLQKAILAQEDQFLFCLTSKLMTYAYGRELGLADQPTVKKIVANLKTNKYTLRALIRDIVLSEPFSTK